MKNQSETESCKSDKQSNILRTYTVDSFSNGIAFGQHHLEKGQDPRDFYALRIQGDSELIQLRSRYALHKTNPLHELEAHLMRLSRQGVLSRASIYLGTTTDPFIPFEGKFDGSMKFLELFQRYTPGMLIVQTRSPLVVIAMPVLRKLGNRAAVTIGIESHLDEVGQRYTPGLPRISERLKAAAALRRFGVEVTIQVSPVLPYGDWKLAAGEFAAVLNEHADYIHVRPLTDGTDRCERKVRSMKVARLLAEDRKFHWLRPDSANPLITAIEKIAAPKLKIPIRAQFDDRQAKIFA